MEDDEDAMVDGENVEAEDYPMVDAFVTVESPTFLNCLFLEVLASIVPAVNSSGLGSLDNNGCDVSMEGYLKMRRHHSVVYDQDGEDLREACKERLFGWSLSR
jgi:hypothetical protein